MLRFVGGTKIHDGYSTLKNIERALFDKNLLKNTVKNLSLQAITLKTYPAELSLSAWICALGTLEGTAVALVMERGNAAVWSIKWDTKLLAASYSVRKIHF